MTFNLSFSIQCMVGSYMVFWCFILPFRCLVMSGWWWVLVVGVRLVGGGGGRFTLTGALVIVGLTIRSLMSQHFDELMLVFFR